VNFYDLAVEKAQQSSNICISTEHLLLGILKEAEINIHQGKGLAIRSLEELGIDIKYIDRQLTSAIASQS
jgi:hypothetical protein